MSETPELPPLPGPAYGWFSDYYDGWSYTENPTDRWQDMLLFTEEQVSAYGRECWEAGRRAGLEELRRLLWDDVVMRRDKIEDRFAMYEEGWFTGLANGLDERSPHCAKTPQEAILYHGELVSRMAARQARRAGLEEAAKLCESEHEQRAPEDLIALACADAIRAKAGACGGTGRAKP